MLIFDTDHDDSDGRNLTYRTPPRAMDELEASCPPASPLRRLGPSQKFPSLDHFSGLDMPELPEGMAASFIESMTRYLDVCKNLQYRHTHSGTSWTFPRYAPLLPIFAPGTFANVAGE